MKKIILLMLLSVFLGGCAYVRVWHKTDSDMPTTEKEVKIALSECEQTNEVASWHSQALTWRYICIGMIWIPVANIGMCLGSDAIAGKYENNLITCIQRANFSCTLYRTDRLGWDALSTSDISMEEWKNQRTKGSPATSSEKDSRAD
jgi:hypothetical protein